MTPNEQGPAPDGTLVIQTAFLGDVILTTGLLRALAERHGPVDVVVTPAAAPLIETHPAVREVIVYDKRGRDRGFRAWRDFAKRLEKRSYARAYLPHRSLRSAGLAWAAKVPVRIGFAGGLPSRLLTHRVTRLSQGHEADRLLALATPIPGPAVVHLELTDADRAEAYKWLASRGLGDGYVAMAPGSIWGTKRWPGFGELIKLLPGNVVVIGGPEDRDVAQALVDVAPDRVVSAAGAVSLRVAAALIERAAVLVTNDSAPLHMATATGTSTAAIFGPTVPEFGFGPRAPKAAIIQRTDLACRPCSSHGPASCPLGHHRCMREIPAATVLDAIEQLVR